MQWSTLDPNDVILAGLGAEYRQRRRIVHDQLVILNTDTFTLTKITQTEQQALATTQTSWTMPAPDAFEETIHNVVGIPLQRFQLLLAALNRTYDVLAFDAGSVLRDIPDDSIEPDSPCDDRPDIVKLLDELALQSDLLYLPERHQALWNDHKLNVWPEQAVRHFNAFRKRAGLFEA